MEPLLLCFINCSHNRITRGCININVENLIIFHLEIYNVMNALNTERQLPLSLLIIIILQSVLIFRSL